MGFLSAGISLDKPAQCPLAELIRVEHLSGGSYSERTNPEGLSGVLLLKS